MRRLEKTIEEIGWTRSVPKLAVGDVVARAFDAMSRESHDCVLVLDAGKLTGVFTSRDFLNRVAATRKDPSKVTLGEVMTPAPRTLRPRDGVGYAINWMALEGFRNVPIVDEEGSILGVLTVWDVLKHLEDVFVDIESTPKPIMPRSEISEVISLVDLGGGG